MPSVKAFIDDNTVICSSLDKSNIRAPRRLNGVIHFKAKMFLSLSVTNGKIDAETPKKEQKTAELATYSLLNINICGLQGKFKV